MLDGRKHEIFLEIFFPVIMVHKAKSTCTRKKCRFWSSQSSFWQSTNYYEWAETSPVGVYLKLRIRGSEKSEENKSLILRTVFQLPQSDYRKHNSLLQRPNLQ